MSSPAQMYDKELNAVKGWPNPYALDKSANVGDSQPTIYAGSVICLNSSAKFVLGLTTAAMPVFALQNSTDFDVVGDDGNIVGLGTGVAHMSGLVATGGYELESTQYDSNGTYNPNTLLSSDAPGGTAPGIIRVRASTETVCGVVSDGTLVNDHGKSVVRFWPVYLPVLS